MGVVTGGGGGGGAGGLSTTTVKLTDAQIKALPSAAVSLVAAQGANKIIVPSFVVLRCDTTNDGYTNIGDQASLLVGPPTGGTSLLGVLGNGPAGTNVPSSARLSSLLAAFDDTLASLVPAFTAYGSVAASPAGLSTSFGISNSTTYFANAALTLQVTNAGNHTGDFTGGNAANFMTILTAYTVVSVAP